MVPNQLSVLVVCSFMFFEFEYLLSPDDRFRFFYLIHHMVENNGSTLFSFKLLPQNVFEISCI